MTYFEQGLEARIELLFARRRVLHTMHGQERPPVTV